MSLSLFEGYGVELEYMIVASDSLDVLPITDLVIQAVAGEITAEIDLGPLSWSNELVLHVIELKTNGPAASLGPLAGNFDGDVARIGDILKKHNARLMPTAAHPWMDPHKETVLWPHEYNPVYESYNRIFSCQGHGWSNLQCTHLNLPFADDDEFGRLHAAIRIVLPLIPALAASSPILDGRVLPILDGRLDVYRNNSKKVPEVTGHVIPEAVYTRDDYRRGILEPLYRAIAPHDPDGILQDEWLNSRGAIARFDRNTIEIRTMDIQESPGADLAILFAVVSVLKALVHEKWSSLKLQQAWDPVALDAIQQATTRNAGDAVIDDRHYLGLFGFPVRGVCRARDLWSYLADQVLAHEDADGVAWEEPIDVVLGQGCLSSRILRALDGDASPRALRSVYARLCDCLDRGSMFVG